ncbi:MAG: alpha-1,4-glucan--maltose-1-phosphate maltosyltransferase [Candidatus Omnitrophica bacterium]|nr:alpha-1,4-glucan--maltose-1-phosphate maltosyltransferase [Candidatus Omnitrophota bacterium]
MTEKTDRTKTAIRRIVIENVWPQIEAGAVAIKRVPGEEVQINADIFTDGHNDISAELLFRAKGSLTWQSVLMTPQGNDRWAGAFSAGAVDQEYTLRAWINPFETWQKEFAKRHAAGQDLASHILIGSKILEQLLINAQAQKIAEADTLLLKKLCAGKLTSQSLLEPALCDLSRRIPDMDSILDYGRTLKVQVDPLQALFSSWYEFFPRSFGKPGHPGRLRDCLPVLKEVARMGFDVVYLPPIHPVGVTKRKGKDNAVTCQPGDPGSPWAIGNSFGGHKAVNPELGTLEDFRWFVKASKELGLAIALDVAYQCSPDHPYVTDHPEWFVKRPDGSIQYAENPPKKYEDVYPLDFNCADHLALWQELKSIIDFWISEGVKIFRIDNPHTKPFEFWQWMLAEVRNEHPEVIFLAEAFTRPKVMHKLAKAGFTQSYTYFTWRTSKDKLMQYVGQLTSGESREVYRPNFWPNTPDILAEHLQNAPRSMFVARFVLAATLSSNYGMYGPVYELCENQPIPGKEEYRDSEKYELRHWDWDRPGNIKDVITKVNHLRKTRTELQTTWNTRFCELENPKLISYLKSVADGKSHTLIVVNLDPLLAQTGWVKLPLYDLKVALDSRYDVVDLLNNKTYHWQGEWNEVKLDTAERPVLIFDVVFHKAPKSGGQHGPS